MMKQTLENYWSLDFQNERYSKPTNAIFLGPIKGTETSLYKYDQKSEEFCICASILRFNTAASQY